MEDILQLQHRRTRSRLRAQSVWLVDKDSEEIGRPPMDNVDENSSDSIHRAIASVLLTAQFFGLMPVQNVTSPAPNQLRFRWASVRVAYSLIYLLVAVVFVICNCLRLARMGISFTRTAGVVFYLAHALSSVLFLQLARNWPHLMQEWTRTEHSLQHQGPPPRLARTARAVTAVILLLGLVEHLLANVEKMYTLRQACPQNWMNLFATQNYGLFEVIEYNGLWVPLLALYNLAATFSWSYADLFIMLVSLAISSRFRQLNCKLREDRPELLSREAWRQYRIDYNSLSQLTKTVNSNVSKLVLLSFGNNLYFICCQLYNSVKPRSSSVPNVIYFYWSFGFLILKTCGVSLLAADIYELSKAPKEILFSVPTENYCVEVKRFLTQVISDEIALTGLNFFPVTRTILLTVAGTIITYEIVLVQFSSLDASTNNTTNILKQVNCLSTSYIN